MPSPRLNATEDKNNVRMARIQNKHTASAVYVCNMQKPLGHCRARVHLIVTPVLSCGFLLEDH